MARFWLLFAFALWLLSPAASFGSEDASSADYFKKHVAPILIEKCVSCHDPKEKAGGLNLEHFDGFTALGDSEEDLVEPGDPDASMIIELITPVDGEAEMPQDAPPLSEKEIAVIRKWIKDGAEWPEGFNVRDASWWSLEPLHKPAVPELATADAEAARWIRTEVDPFVLRKLREQGLKPSPAADRATLIRRLYFDLTGLPPSPEAVEKFVADEDPMAYEKLVEELLASPRYGERWARHWLDVVHYGETHGYDKDKPRPNAWPYRDYVIRWLNEDKRYDRFIREQIAGDILYPGTIDGIEALGFIAAGPWDHIGHAEIPETKIDGKIARHLDRDDMVQNTITSLMSLTVGCAQCHDHKFEPITQKDYYSLHAVFAALDRSDRQYDDDPAITEQRDKLYKVGVPLRKRVEKMKSELKKAKMAMPAEGEEADAAAKANKDGDKKKADELPSIDELEKKIAAGEEELTKIRADLAALPAPKKAYIGMIHSGFGTFTGTGHTGGKPRDIHVLLRGNILTPGEKVGPAALRLFDELPADLDVSEDAPEGARRVALANWLTDTRNPLTWRSITNRVWQYHFGRGIVDTPNDFGRMGGIPTHPELLDYLAAEFRDGNQSLKDLHRIILNSATYRQSSHAPATLADKGMAVDAQNRYLWRANRRQLDAEAIRDSILHVSGKLDLTMGGPSFQDFIIDKPEHSPHYEYRLHDPEDPKSHRRSIYRFLVRSQTQPFMTVLDCADPSMMVAKRSETISPLQSLALLNNKLAVVMAKHFAKRIETVEGDDEARIREAFRLALSRSPDAEELAALRAYAQEHGLANTCRVLFNVNEFVFVD